MVMCFTSQSFHPLKNRIKSLACLWNICLCWNGFSHIHVLTDLWHRNESFQGAKIQG